MPEPGRFSRELRSLLWKPSVSAEVSEEVAHHMEMLERDLIAQGVAPAEARVRAHERFGSIEQVAELCTTLGEERDIVRRRSEWWSEFGQDARRAVRQLQQSKQFAVVAIATLAAGLGAAMTILAIADAVLLRPLPFARADQLVLVAEKNPAGADFAISQSNYLDWRSRLRSFEGVTAFEERAVALLDGGAPEQVRSASVTHSFFTVLGASPVVGRTFTVDDDLRGGDTRVAVLSHGLWQRRFGSERGVVGRQLDIGGVAHRIIGIMHEGFEFPAQTDVWVPLAPDPAYPRDDRRLRGIGRLKAGVSLAQAQQEIEQVAGQLAAEYGENAGWSASARPFKDWYVSPQLDLRMKALLATVVLLLGMAWINVASLLLARASTRDREMAVRIALGAGKWRVMRQLFTESLVLSVAGSLAGLGLAVLLVPVIRQVGPAAIPRLSDLAIDWRVIAMTLPICILTALTLAIATAFRFRQHRNRSGDRLHDLLRSGARVAESGRARAVLIVASVAMAMMLLVAAGLVATSFRRLMAVDLGFSTERVLIANVTLPTGRYDTGRVVTFVAEAEARLAALEGVRAVGATSIAPFSGGNTAMDLTPEERAGESRARYRMASWRTITPGYFDAMGIALRQGRRFSDQDRLREGMNPDTDRSVIVNDILATTVWPGENPIGRRLSLVSGNAVTVVGVVGSTRHLAPDSAAGPSMYFAHAQFPTRSMWFTVRTLGDPGQRAADVRQVFAALDPQLPVAGLQSMDALLVRTAAEPRLTMLVFAIFALAALVLVAVGLYGVVAYSVSQRTREIGVTIALGASPRRVVREVLDSGLRLGALGVAIGGALSPGLAGALRSILYGTEATDGTTYALVAGVLITVTTIASAIPARRAARLDPVKALRGES
jgi:putative ABC transport system permease protein